MSHELPQLGDDCRPRNDWSFDDILEVVYETADVVERYSGPVWGHATNIDPDSIRAIAEALTQGDNDKDDNQVVNRLEWAASAYLNLVDLVKCRKSNADSPFEP